MVVWFFITASLAVGLAVLYARKRRQERAVHEFSDQLLRLTRDAGATGRIGIHGKPAGLLRQLGTAVNKLLEDVEQRGARLLDREQLFQRLVEAVHDAVLVHREHIVFVNARFLALLNLSAADVVGRPLTDFVAPEYIELVASNLKRRLRGEPAAERYEIELIGA
jgi:PAS domain-containing protein